MTNDSHRLITNSYLVVFRCPQHVVETQSSKFFIPEGVYIYVGSCGRSCIKRVLRHINRPKRRRWHIDYIKCDALYAVVLPHTETYVANVLTANCPYVEGLGSSDDVLNPSHFFKCEIDKALYLLGLTK
ncbi:MAG: DUF123 domain-containing protein [Pyrobaculum sp.]